MLLRRIVGRSEGISSRLFSSEYVPTIFDKILSKEIKSDIVYEDDKCLAFRDISPQAPVHVLIIPKIRGGLSQLRYSTEDDRQLLGHLMYIAGVVAKQEKLEKGWRLVVNDGEDAHQTVFHLHLHVLGGRKMGWPPG